LSVIDEHFNVYINVCAVVFVIYRSALEVPRRCAI